MCFLQLYKNIYIALNAYDKFMERILIIIHLNTIIDDKFFQFDISSVGNSFVASYQLDYFSIDKIIIKFKF